MIVRRQLRRLHIWLGWLIGIPLLFWTISGVVMTLRPIDVVRGSDLRVPAPPIAPPTRVTPPRTTAGLTTLAIEFQGGRSVWIATFPGGARRADLATGQWLPGVSSLEAHGLADAVYRPDARVLATTRFTAAQAPLDLRRARPAWQVAFSDGARVYVDADTGQVLALRTRWWRFYDWMWGLHIMDLQSREDTSHGILIAFAAVALVATILGLMLLPLTKRRRRVR